MSAKKKNNKPAPKLARSTKKRTPKAATSEVATAESVVASEQSSAETAEPLPSETVADKKPSRRKRTASVRAEGGALSALDAAAKVLAEAGEAMNTRQLIEAMAEKGYWTSPGGKTPAATLFSAMLREINTKGDASRFVKTERGKFALKA